MQNLKKEGERREYGLISKYKNTHIKSYLFLVMLVKIGSYVALTVEWKMFDYLYVHQENKDGF